MGNQRNPANPLPSPRGRGTRRLRLETLEDRRMLATFTVSSLADAGADTLRQAILDANGQAGADTIEFDPSLFSTAQTINLASQLPTITEDLTISGPGQDLLKLHAGNGLDNLPGTGDGFRLLEIVSENITFDATISGLTLTGGDVAGAGGAILSRENLTLIDTNIIANATGPGVDGADGSAGENGENGSRGGDGGGVFSSGGDLTLLDSTISGNSTGRGGKGGDGGDGADGPDGAAGGDGGNGGSGGYGGGIFSDGGSLMITNSTISGNSTGSGGWSGGGGNGGQPELGGIGGRGGNGGDGGYGGDGGGIYSSVGQLTMSNSTISGNFTGIGRDGGPGGIGGLGALGGNGGDGGNGGSGGGIYSFEYPIAITSSTITGNEANAGGSAGTPASGGFDGINGTNGNGGGLDSLGNDPVDIDNTIIAGNLAAGIAPDMRTGSVSLNINHSLIGVGDGLNISSGTANQIGSGLSPIGPQLGPLAHNGGTTWTHAPMPGSPVIDAGDPSILPNPAEFDQRGMPFLRVEDGNPAAGTTIDIGAYEAQAPPTADFDQDSDVDGADFLRWQRGFGITSGALLADGNSDDDGDVDASDRAVWLSTYGDNAPAIAASRFAADDSATSVRSADIAFAALGDADRNSSEIEPPRFAAASAQTPTREPSELPSVGGTALSGSDAIDIESAAEKEETTLSDALQDLLISRLF